MGAGGDSERDEAGERQGRAVSVPHRSRDLLEIASRLEGSFDSELIDYRRRLCEFCDRELAGARPRYSDANELGGWSTEFAASFRRELGRHGFFGQSWPEPYGPGKSLLYDVVLADELEYHDAPAGAMLDSSILHVPPMLIAYAQPEVLDAAIPLFRAGEASVALGYSEPEAGSDLASLAAKAVYSERHGLGEYRITGEKAYTSDAHTSTHALVAARIDDGRWTDKHEGITLFWVPMDREGISVHAERTVTGAMHHRITLHEVVATPGEVVGEPGSGWHILTQGLSHERAVHGNPGLAELELHELLRHRAAGAAGPADTLEAMIIENEARSVSYVLAVAAAEGTAAPSDGSLVQVVKRESVRSLQELRLTLGTPQGLDDAFGSGAPGATAEWHWLRDLFYLFAAGGLDVSRTVIAKDVLRQSERTNVA